MTIIPPDALTVAVMLALPGLLVMLLIVLLSRRNETW